MNLESLEQENKEYIKRLSQKKTLPMIGISLIVVFILYDSFKTDISIFHALGLIIFTISGILLLNFTKLNEKDKLIDDFFYENHLVVLENLREINNYNSFAFSKEHLSIIIRDIAYRIKKLRHTEDTEYVLNERIDKIDYDVTYKVVKNECKTDIFQIAFRIKERYIRSPFWRVSEETKESLPLDLMNVLYSIKKSKRKKPEKSFKILKITGNRRWHT